MDVFSPSYEPGMNGGLQLLALGADLILRTQLQALAQSGYRLVFANDGPEALDFLCSGDLPVVAILDWTAQWADLWQAIPPLKQRRHLYVIVLLNWAERDHRGEALRSGADDCLYKPTGAEQLQRRIQFGSQLILERALRDSEERFRIAFEQAVIGMAMIDLYNGKFLQVNQALCDFLGYTREELLVRDIMSVSHPENVPTSGLLVAQLAHGEFNGEQMERRYIRKDGAVVWALVSLSLVRDSEGRCAYVSSQFKDITKRKEAEQAQQQAEVFAQAIMDNIEELVMVIDLQGKCRYASPSHLQGLGYEPRELIGESAYCTLHPDDRPLVDCAMQQAMSTGRAPTVTVRRIHKNGSVHHVEARGTLVRGVCDSKDGFVLVSRNIDERLLAEHKLREASAETELFLQSIPSILIGLDAQGHIIRWNRSAAEVFHLASDDVLGRPIEHCGINWLHPEIGFQVSRWIQTEDSHRCEDLPYELDHDRRYVGFNVRRMEGDADQPPRFLITGADVTERKTLEDQLRQAQKLEAIGQLAAGIAHEINTPTQYVGDNTRFLQESWRDIANLLALSQSICHQAQTGVAAKELLQKFDSLAAESDLSYLIEEVPKAIEQSLDGVQRVAKIVKAMKDFSHPGSQEKRAVDINQAIESTIAVARHEWKYVSNVVTDLQPDLPPVPCLIGEFNQVILNLIVNAAHAIAEAKAEGLIEKGTITIRTYRHDEWAEIAVQDTGTGIPVEIQPRIFEPFFTTKPVGRGTGQGLSLAHSVIVKRHQGQIWFETEIGRGTTFFLRLPFRVPENVS
jgi:PAS domain S-box-containing protein